MTKPAGKPRGRPRKAKAPKPLRRRGRPEKPLSEREDRHALAFIQAALDRPDLDMSERALTTMLAGLRYGRVVETRENLKAMLKGEPFLVAMDPTESRAVPDDGRWRHGNAFRPRADDIARTLRRARSGSVIDKDRRWLSCMSRAWAICLQRRVDEAWLAAHLAAMAGESEYFEQVMEPILMRGDKLPKAALAGLTRLLLAPPELAPYFFTNIFRTQTQEICDL
ncbi:MAG TPA: hypothetical protein VIG36_13420 [Methylocystis sp.]|jgi:hypothetical protein